MSEAEFLNEDKVIELDMGIVLLFAEVGHLLLVGILVLLDDFLHVTADALLERLKRNLTYHTGEKLLVELRLAQQKTCSEI